MEQTTVDSLIIGQGLAGSLLAWRLVARGEKVLVVDNGYASSSSTVAAGLINPVTGKRLVKTVGVDAYLPRARETYHALEEVLGVELLVDKPMLRLFHRKQERERWQRRQQEPGYQDYIGDVVESSQLPAPIVASHGAGRQLQTAYLRTEPLLHGLRDWLQQRHSSVQAQFDYADLQLQAEGVTWRGVHARRVIFCEGYKGMMNPWFGGLPFQPARGEFLTVRSSGALPDLIINSGRWLMPRSDGLYRVGASYDHQPLDESITVEARQMLLAALPTFLAPSPEFEVVEQQAGVRPTTRDRQPFIGLHPHHPMLAIFNGFGSKGSLLIPWHVERFVASLLDATPLPLSIDVARYRGKFNG
jgi:glycine/D-amino acid oxidase-like deaminating enzyme